jgi:ATP-binding cassette subfamily F protein uup
VSRLSGGEQARLLIARLMLQPADLLILDEPTNDLDIPTLEVLEDSLLEFPGALVLVTHDRWLLDRVSTILLALDGTGRVDWFADYAQCENAQERKPGFDKELTSNGTVDCQLGKTAGDSTRKPKKLSYREQKEWGTIEDTILKAEEWVTACQAAMHDPTVLSDAAELQARHAALVTAQAEVERLYSRWAELDRNLAKLAKP